MWKLCRGFEDSAGGNHEIRYCRRGNVQGRSTCLDVGLSDLDVHLYTYQLEMSDWLVRTALIPVLWLTCTFNVLANERVALVIGNSNYKTAPLLNPSNDAKAMAELLGQAGFSVAKQLDTSRDQLQAAVDRFGLGIRDAKVKFGVFYYAGHGMQLDWRNYLVPVSANIRTSTDVPSQTVDVSHLLRYMEQAKGRSFLIILDACRDDPFAGAFRPPAKGLSQFDAPVGSLLAYATAPGTVARDGNGKNGLYTGFLLREFAVQGARLEDAFKRVRLSVRLASKGAQVPWESTSLEEDLYFFPSPTRSMSEADRDDLLEREMNAWRVVKVTTDPELLAGFVRQYPSGSASELAQARMNRLLAAMAEQENQRLQIAAQSAKQALQELEAREAAARLRAAQVEEERITAQRLEVERVRLAQAEAAREERIRKQAEQQAAERAEFARQAAERAELAQGEAQRVGVMRQEAAQLLAAKAEAERVAEIARQSHLQAQNAKMELDRIQALQLQHEAAERALAVKAEMARAEQARLERDQREEVTRLAQERNGLLAAAAQVTVQTSLSSTPYFVGFDEHWRQYSVGDLFNLQVVDQLSKSAKPLTMKVTQVEPETGQVVFNNGEFVSDMMGNTTTNLRGSFSTPRQFYPAELMVAKKWHTRFKQSRPNGVTYTFQYDLKVAAKERITVPAGTFDAYKIEARGFNIELGAHLERNIWVTPGINSDIAHEIVVRLRSGAIDQYDRQELVSYKQAK